MAQVDNTGSIFFEQGGVLVHIPSGMKFPSVIRPFRRGPRPTVYDRLGYNVSVAYHDGLPLFRIATTTLTAFVYPGPLLIDETQRPLHREFQKLKDDVFNVHPTATIVREDEAVLTDREYTAPGKMVTFLIPTRFGRLLSEAYLFRRGIWQLKYRITYPRLSSGRSAAGVKAVMQTLGCPRGT